MAKSLDPNFDSSIRLQNKKIKPLIVVVLLAVVFIPLSIMAFNYVQDLRTEAVPPENPQNVEVSNIQDTSVSVSWTTPGKKTNGFIKYGTGQTLDDVGYDKRDSGDTNGEYSIHYVDLVNLTPETKYFYTVIVDGKEFDNEGKMYTFTTGPVLESIQTPRPLKGEIEDPTDSDEELIVFLYVQNAGEVSSKISTITTNRRYTLDLSNIRTANLKSSYASFENAKLYLTAEGGERGTGSLVTEIIQK